LANNLTDALQVKLASYVTRMSAEMDAKMRREIMDPGPWMSSKAPAALSYNGAQFRIDDSTPDGVAYAVREGEYVINSRDYARMREMSDGTINRVLGEPPVSSTPRAPPPDPHFPRKLDID
jgi:hypothetical protein